MPPHVRQSLQEIQNLYETGQDKSKLENLIRAFRGVQALPSENPNSFWRIGGFHGEPFRGKGTTDPDWWGGYCNHGNVLFPTWHRAYLLRLENALRSIPGCKDVTLPFWDELANYGAGNLNFIPSILTEPTFKLDGRTDNPLYSYKLQEALVEKVEGTDARYSKPKGYETVRYPLSGLVGTEQDKKNTQAHNASYSDPKKNTEILNANVGNWLEGTVHIHRDPIIRLDPKRARIPDTYSAYSRYMKCLEAPNYTVFSNNSSQNQWIKDHSGDKHYVVALENPHNAIHLAVGGFYQRGEYNADPILGANGDMGDNETAGFDPIFYFHHCFVDYAFWVWQKKNQLTSAGSLDIIPGYAGTISAEGLPNIDPNTPLDMKTPLYPFKKPDESWYTSYDVTDIENQLSYTYGLGSLDSTIPIIGEPIVEPIVLMKRVHNINRGRIPGSFVIRTYAKGPDGKEVEIGRDAILSRWSTKGCKNCLDKLEVESMVPIHESMLAVLRGEGKNEDIEYWAELQTHDPTHPPVPGLGERPIVGDL